MTFRLLLVSAYVHYTEHFNSSVTNVNEGTRNNRDPSAGEPRVQNE